MKTLQGYILVALFFLSLMPITSCNKTEGPTAVQETSIDNSNSGSSFLKGGGPSANGQGRIAGTDRTFAFNAVTHHDGSVSGQGQLNTHTGAKVHFSIDCLSVDGNVATLSGTVTSSNISESGGPCWFRVKDNGEGANAPPDEITFFLFCDGPNDPDPICSTLTCDVDHEGEAGGLNPIENGNIQVKP